MIDEQGTPETAPEILPPPELDAWLERIGLSRGRAFGPWQLFWVETTPGDQRRVAVDFTHRQSREHVIRVLLRPTDRTSPAFARSASLDISHASVPPALMAAAAKLTRAIHTIIEAHDPGGLPTPPAFPAPANEVEASAEAASEDAPADHRIEGGSRLDDFLDTLAVEAGQGESVSSFPTQSHRDHLEQTVAISEALRAAYRRDGHVIVRGALDEEMLRAAREVVTAALVETLTGHSSEHEKPVGERVDEDARQPPIAHLGRHDAAIRVLTQSRRLAKMAADLMGVPSVRIFCEDWFIKEPRADSTPWHQDSSGMSFDAQATITVWIPFAPVEKGMGALRFARGSHRSGVFVIDAIDRDAARPVAPPSTAREAEADGERAMVFHFAHARADSELAASNCDDAGQAAFAEIIRSHGWEVDINPPMRLGDVSFHDGSTIHGGLQNDSDAPRIAVALHCFADGAVIKEPVTMAMRNFRQMYAPELETGAPAATHFWPLVYRADDPSLGTE